MGTFFAIIAAFFVITFIVGAIRTAQEKEILDNLVELHTTEQRLIHMKGICDALPSQYAAVITEILTATIENRDVNVQGNHDPDAVRYWCNDFFGKWAAVVDGLTNAEQELAAKQCAYYLLTQRAI